MSKNKGLNPDCPNPECDGNLKADYLATASRRQVWIQACYKCMWWEPVNGKLESCCGLHEEEEDE